ncbi:MAG: methylated-DNA--[protein]-cysteine S-methyltransferase [Deltaproteobacteria bacterium]
MNHVVVDSPIGPLRLEANERALTRVDLPNRVDERVTGPTNHPVLRAALRELAAYFEGTLQKFETPFELEGTEFQRLAWSALVEIPYATTRSYAEQARAIGRPTATRAVGAANGKNPIPIIVPCHRVLGANGSLTGFGGGVEVKRWLLDHEARHAGLRLPLPL